MSVAGLVEVRVPDMGNFKDVAIIDVLVKPGESIEPEAPLVTLETEKATMDVPSTVGGVIEKLHIQKGGTVSAGDLIATVRSQSESDAPATTGDAPESGRTGASVDTANAKPPADGDSAAPQSAAKPPSVASTREPPAKDSAVESPSAGDSPVAGEPGFSRAHAGPSVRKLARELGVDLTRVSGNGFKGRVTHDDVKAYVKGALAGAGATRTVPGSGAGLPALPSVDFAAFGEVERRPLSRIQKISGPRLHASWVNIPHVTQFDSADITELEELRAQLRQRAEQKGIKLTALAFIVRACVRALQEFPNFNASLDPDGATLVLKKYVNVGFAADTPNGLVVPVVHEADRKDIYEIARQLGELSAKARGGKLSPAEMQGGCFTISSLGGIGGTAFTPIINAPEVAILGVSRSSLQPVFRDGAFVPRLLLPLSLSYDHRVIDGAAAARFTTFLGGCLAEARRLIEAVP